ncbi:galactose mutarotase-like [Bombus pascuorum]|uniref:galactose mutarotase-like n=1 Tax=Bombus pascuorum TaxID=65598 RepID=UPI00298E2A1C|nr:galactose mutarotase-like [Bombus pascuorum]
MTNKHKASVQLISWGAGIQAIKVPNQSGILGDVVLGFDDMEGYLKNRYIGSIIGRVVNRISCAKMRIENKIYCLSPNDENGLDHFNGGFVGFDNVNWNSYIMKKHVVMSHVSPAKCEGYPGDMLTQIKYSWTDDNQLLMNIRATATQPTPVNIASNCLMNLAGHVKLLLTLPIIFFNSFNSVCTTLSYFLLIQHGFNFIMFKSLFYLLNPSFQKASLYLAAGSRELKKHLISLNADSWTPADIRNNLPTDAIYPVDRTVFDLRLPTQLTKRRLYIVPGGGYNQNLCVNSPSSWSYRFHARIIHPGSGRTLEVYSNHPGLQFSTGNDLPDPDCNYPPDFEDYCDCTDNEPEIKEQQKEIWGKDGVRYQRHGGFILSPQNYPDAVNISNFPPCILYPGQVYAHDVTYKFGLLSENLDTST